MPDIISADQAVALIQDNKTICIGGGGAGHAVPDEILRAMGKRFKNTGKPVNLTILHPCGIGDSDSLGLNHIAYPDMLKRIIGGFYGNAPKMVELALNDQFEGYNFPQGVLSHLTRAIAAGEPGLITKTGLHTFVDPRYEGGKVNASAKDDLVELVQIGNEELLYYKTMPVDVAIIRGSSVDRNGNLSMENEVGTFAMLSIAQAAKVNNGIVIAQVREVREGESTPSSSVKVPAALIDHIVLAPGQPMTYITDYDLSMIRKDQPFTDDELRLEGIKKIVARRGAMELFPGAFVNLGYGISDGIPIVAREENFLDQITFLIEQGPLGGIPTTGLNFGAMYNPDAILDDGYQFDFFHGGGLDIAYLGFAEIDKNGNVNSSRFGNRMTGCGGFIDISQHTNKIIFCGSFAARGEIEFQDDGIRVTNKGKYKKFVSKVGQITFNGKYALNNNHEILYLTERAVFQLTEEGLLLIEIAPGVRLEEDILSMMDFKPKVATDLKLMDRRLFSEKMDLELKNKDLQGF
jgi:propionate CoA-transferase